VHVAHKSGRYTDKKKEQEQEPRTAHASNRTVPHFFCAVRDRVVVLSRWLFVVLEVCEWECSNGI